MHCVEKAAEDLMVDPEDLAEVFEAFFEKIEDFYASCDEAIKDGDCISLVKLFHSKKGTSANLRMEEIRNLAFQMEVLAKNGEVDAVSIMLDEFKEKLFKAKIEIEQYYAVRLAK